MNDLRHWVFTEHDWFAGKKKFDAMNVLPIMEKCVGYVNKIFDK